MLGPSSYDYAIIRLVPRVERGELLNVGVILFCRARRYLNARIEFDTGRLQSFWPNLDLDLILEHLAVIPLLCRGGEEASPLGILSPGERFHWLVSPRSTIIQVSPVHSGLCQDPSEKLDSLFTQLVALPPPDPG